MRLSHALVFLLGALLLSPRSSLVLSAHADSKVTPLHWAAKRQRPQAVKHEETIEWEIGALDMMRVLARYSGKTIVEKMLFARTAQEPAILYVRVEGCAEYDAYRLPYLECCVAYEPSPLLVRR